MKITNEIKEFIRVHLHEDVRDLALKSALYPYIDIKFAVKQISGKQAVKTKIPLFYENENIIFPPKISLEQTSSEATALYKASLCKGKSFVDLTGGFGCDCYFISLNFENAVFVEQNQELCDIAISNFKALKATNIKVECTDAVKYLENLKYKTDLIYLDPARRNSSGGKTVSISDCTPDVNDLSEILVSKSNNVLLKLSPLIDISLAVKELKFVNEVHVVSVENECKEVLFMLSSNHENDVRITSINIKKDKINQAFTFNYSEESRREVTYASAISTYIYEPNSSILKAGAFKSISTHFDLDKLDINTHLYSSDNLLADFPGRIFKVEKIFSFSKAGISGLKSITSKANITVRNFPLTVQEIRKKTGIKEGGNHYIFASKFRNDNLMILCKKVST